MTKKIRFPLKMEDGVEVRSMEELREHFSLVKVMEYLNNGKLIIWLRDRYANDIADAIEQLDQSEQNLAKRVCEIFDIPYDEKVEEDLEEAADRAERVQKLKQYTDEKKFITEIDNVAFDQDELYDLLDKNANKIYLCGDKFSIPLSKSGVIYVGINNPTVAIDSKVKVDWDAIGISIDNVTFDDKYEKLLCNSKEYFIEKRKIKTDLNPDGGDTAVLIEKNGHDLQERIIACDVVDYFEYENFVYVIVKEMYRNPCTCSDNMVYSAYKYEKETAIIKRMTIIPTYNSRIFSQKVLPKARTICVTPSKIVYLCGTDVHVMDHDGDNRKYLHECGLFVTPITSYENDYYYINDLYYDNSLPLFRYDLQTKKNVILATGVYLVLYHGDYIYCASADEPGNPMGGWRIVEINMKNKENKQIYFADSQEHWMANMRIENGKLQIQNYETKKYVDIKEV